MLKFSAWKSTDNPNYRIKTLIMVKGMGVVLFLLKKNNSKASTTRNYTPTNKPPINWNVLPLYPHLECIIQKPTTESATPPPSYTGSGFKKWGWRIKCQKGGKIKEIWWKIMFSNEVWLFASPTISVTRLDTIITTAKKCLWKHYSGMFTTDRIYLTYSPCYLHMY